MSELWIEREDGKEMVVPQNSGDMIYRQDAIDAVEHTKSAKAPDGEVYVAKINAEMNIQLLPSAQPEIVRCKDCKHNPKLEWFGCPMSHLNEKQRPETAWCWKGERRNDD